jgi:hypothetical protein
MPSTTTPIDFQVSRTNLRECRSVEAPAPDRIELDDCDALLAVDRFGLTANNVTYGVAGDMLSYWNFFPAPEGWGRIPVWGFADVIRSRHPELPEGERLFGYFPPSSHVRMRIGAVTPSGLVEGSPHRSKLPSFYNRYTRTGADPLYERASEPRQMLLRPLFTTAFLLDDFLTSSQFFGARALLITSASSKTGSALAFRLKGRRAGIEVVGLTSAARVAFVEGLGCYDRVLDYEKATSLPASTPVAIVDVAGDAPLIGTLHHHFGDNVKHNTILGLTHWERTGSNEKLPGATPALFFAPDHRERMAKGGGSFEDRLVQGWREFLAGTKSWLRIVEDRGPAAVERVYRDLIEGRARADEGYVLSLRTAG